jgi:SAV_6107-like HEPN
MPTSTATPRSDTPATTVPATTTPRSDTLPTTVPATTSAPGASSSSAASSAQASLELLDRSRHSLLEACHSREIGRRHLHAQLGALRAAAAVVAARATPGGQPGPRSLWELLPSVAPELSEWAGFFELVASRPAPSVSAREADDLVRQSEIFLDLACRTLGLPVPTDSHDEGLVPTVPVAGGSPP